MDYHLHRNGQNAGIFPLEELRRRRAAGEVSGGDLVWCEGMAAWAPLDSVLQQTTFSERVAPHPPPTPATALRPRSHRLLLGVLVTVGVIVFLAFTGFIATRFMEGFRRGLKAAHRTADASPE